VPFFGIAKTGIGGYLKTYIKPTFIMLPFNLISELTRTLALAVRLFGNMMSGGLIVAILLSITPLIFPIVMKALLVYLLVWCKPIYSAFWQQFILPQQFMIRQTKG
jgi:F0F1-type ATP synthase membrane subunit a